MKYQKFVIKNYRAVVGPTEINLQKSRLMPIIGINESGKTTILQALFAFDYFNDHLNDNGRHLKDLANLYQTASGIPSVQAEILITKNELTSAIKACAKKQPNLQAQLGVLERKRSLPTTLQILRNLKSRKYRMSSYFPAEVHDVLARHIIAGMPYILYFDDFRDKITEKIEISSDAEELSEWASIIEQLFDQTDPTFSIRKLANMEERQRKTVLAKVERKLNTTLTKQWQTFKLDDREDLKISVDFYQEKSTVVPPASGTQTLLTAQQTAVISSTQTPSAQVPPTPAPVMVVRNFIKLEIIETIGTGDAHYFYISDRSKGFYWFFNFVMKLEFNPKFVSDETAIYLLDEPGSYLHAFAQQKLCRKLRDLSEKNSVIYCTHSHYLLDPEVIPLNSIRIAEKDSNRAICLTPLTSYRSSITEKRSALQPVLDALQIKPFSLNVPSTRTTIITEGIYDYFALELFREERDVSILPSVGADSIKYYISLMIAWQIDFRALWDNDPEGSKKFREATEKFGQEISDKYFRLLALKGKGSKRILQDLFHGDDLSMIRAELGLDSNCSFETILQALFYSPQRGEIVTKINRATIDEFTKLFEILHLEQ